MLLAAPASNGDGGLPGVLTDISEQAMVSPGMQGCLGRMCHDAKEKLDAVLKPPACGCR